jgi:hypothetical protein
MRVSRCCRWHGRRGYIVCEPVILECIDIFLRHWSPSVETLRMKLSQRTSNVIIYSMISTRKPIIKPYQSEGYSQLKYASSGASCFQFNRLVSLHCAINKRNVEGIACDQRRSVKNDGISTREHTESPKCLLILPLKGWKPPPAGILRVICVRV